MTNVFYYDHTILFNYVHENDILKSEGKRSVNGPIYTRFSLGMFLHSRRIRGGTIDQTGCIKILYFKQDNLTYKKNTSYLYDHKRSLYSSGLMQANKVLEFLSVDVYETRICMKIRSFLMSGNLRMKRAHARDVDKKIFGLAYIYIYIYIPHLYTLLR